MDRPAFAGAISAELLGEAGTARAAMACLRGAANRTLALPPLPIDGQFGVGDPHADPKILWDTASIRGKTCEQGFFLGKRHALMLAAAIRLGLERLDAALLISHVHTALLRDTPIAAAISGYLMPLSRSSTVWMVFSATARCSAAAPQLCAFDYLAPPESGGANESYFRLT